MKNFTIQNEGLLFVDYGCNIDPNIWMYEYRGNKVNKESEVYIGGITNLIDVICTIPKDTLLRFNNFSNVQLASIVKYLRENRGISITKSIILKH